jgi:hypothetical protein
MYVFGGFGAPIALKSTCAKESDKKVDQKFALPLDFDKDSKNALREFWHFSYYRACLFEEGYDFSGNVIKPSTITRHDDGSLYTNYFGGIAFAVPGDTIIIEDNSTNPDLEDRRITSVLKIGEHEVTVLAYRSFDDIDSFDELEDGFMGFSTSTGDIVEKVVRTNQQGANVLSAYQDDGLFGFASVTKKGRIIKVFGKKLPKELLELIESSLVSIQNK